MRKLKTILQSRFLFKIIAILLLIYSILVVTLINKMSIYNSDDTLFVGTIIDKKISDNKLTLVLYNKEKLLINYYFNYEWELEYYDNYLKLGDVISVNGILSTPKSNTIKNGFNYKKYLYYQKIYWIVNANKIKKIRNNTSILYYIKNIITDRIDMIDNTGYLRTFILGDKSFLDNEMIDIYRKNGISHLFSISGMHISFISGLLLFILNRVSYNNKFKYSVVISFLFFYLFLTNYSASIVRTVIMFIVNAINKCFNLKIRKIDIICIVLIIACVISPYYIYSMGFQFSFIISSSLIIFSLKCKTKFRELLWSSFVCFIISFPICIYYFYQVNILSILYNLFMIPFVSMIVFPLSFISLFFSFVFPLYHIVLMFLEKVNVLIGNIDFLVISFFKPSLFFLLIVYFFIFLVFFYKRYYFLLILIVLIWKLFPYFISDSLVTMIDVGQGDSILVRYPYQSSVVLIDTGGIALESNNYSIALDKIIPYLKSLGVTNINYLILSHGDFDHMGEAINLVENFKVEKVIFNCGPYNDLENELIRVLDKKKIKYYSCIKELDIDKNKLYFLQTKEYENENDNSNVIYTELDDYKFMFMGDASITTENEILDKYNLLDIDVLKVGHHGSRTSSSKEFIDEISPKNSIISVGKKNRYGHPNKEVLETLKNSKIYRTDLDGSIEIKLNNNGYSTRTCPP